MTALAEALAIAEEHLDWSRPNDGRGRDPNYARVAASVGVAMPRRCPHDVRAWCIAILAAEWLALPRCGA